jgi:hypothetical protein
MPLLPLRGYSVNGILRTLTIIALLATLPRFARVILKYFSIILCMLYFMHINLPLYGDRTRDLLRSSRVFGPLRQIGC